MAGVLEVDGATATVSFVFTAETDKAQATITNAAEMIYTRLGTVVYRDENDVPIPFSELTAQQLVDIVDKTVRDLVMYHARENLVSSAIETARDTAEDDDSIELT